MADIRAPQWPVLRPPANPAPKADARAQAQRAFFEAALAGRTEATPEAAPFRAPDLRIQMPASAPPSAPEKILRPGSIIDIKV